MHDSRPLRVAEPGGTQLAHLRVARQQPRDERARALARPGMHDLARRLIDDAKSSSSRTTSTSTESSGCDVAAGSRRQDRRQVLTLAGATSRAFTTTLSLMRDGAARAWRRCASERERPVNIGEHAVDAKRVEATRAPPGPVSRRQRRRGRATSLTAPTTGRHAGPRRSRRRSPP